MNLLRALLGQPRPLVSKDTTESQKRVEEEIEKLQEPKQRLERVLDREGPADAIRQAQRLREEAR